MKKRYLLALIPIAAMIFYFSQEKPQAVFKEASIIHQAPAKKIIPQHDLRSVDASRLPVVSNQEAPARIKTLKMMKSKRDVAQEVTKSGFKLPHGLAVAEHVFAIDKDDYSPSMGETVSENGKQIFFRADSKPAGLANVAVDQLNNKYYPISAIVKLENISEDTRQSLKGQGIEENYYHDELKIMYVQSSHDEVLNLYIQLAAMHLDASLEVTKGFHKPR